MASSLLSLLTAEPTPIPATPAAIALQQQLRPALQQIQGALLEVPHFDPATSDRLFAIGLSDYGAFTLLPRLMQRLQVMAPQVRVQMRSGDRQKLLSLLDRGEIDLACGVFPERVSQHRQQVLFEESYVCVCRQNHPTMGNGLSLEDYLATSHLLVSIQEDRVGRMDILLAEQNLKRHMALSIPHFLTAPFILAQTDLVATLAQRIAQGFSHTQALQVLPLPIAMKGFTVMMRWHQNTENLPDCQWLRSLILDIGSTV